MLDKVSLAVYKAYWDLKLRIMKLGQEEDGMETIETVILIAVAVVIAGFILNFLTKGDDGKGLIGRIFETIENKITELFN